MKPKKNHPWKKFALKHYLDKSEIDYNGYLSSCINTALRKQKYESIKKFLQGGIK